MENSNLIIKDKDNKKKKCRLLFSFTSNENDKSYIVFTDDKKNKKGEVGVYARSYDITGKSADLKSVTSDKVFEIIENTLEFASLDGE